MRLQSQYNRVRAVHRKLFPPPKQERWMPMGVWIDEDGNFVGDAEAVYNRCEKLGITPNVYVVSDDWNPDMDGVEP